MPGLKRQTVSKWLNSLASEQDACIETVVHSDSTFQSCVERGGLLQGSANIPEAFFLSKKKNGTTHAKRFCLKPIYHFLCDWR